MNKIIKSMLISFCVMFVTLGMLNTLALANGDTPKVKRMISLTCLSDLFLHTDLIGPGDRPIYYREVGKDGVASIRVTDSGIAIRFRNHEGGLRSVVVNNMPCVLIDKWVKVETQDSLGVD